MNIIDLGLEEKNNNYSRVLKIKKIKNILNTTIYIKYKVREV